MVCTLRLFLKPSLQFSCVGPFCHIALGVQSDILEFETMRNSYQFKAAEKERRWLLDEACCIEMAICQES